MKAMGIKVKILSQEAVEFMQFDPMQKVEDILRDMAMRVLPDRCDSIGGMCVIKPILIFSSPARRGTTLTTAFICSERTLSRRAHGCKKIKNSMPTNMALRYCGLEWN